MIENLKLVKYGHIALRRKCKLIKNFNPILKEIADKMFHVMKENNGIGLAANQLGLPWSMFVTNIDNKSMVFINPIISFKKNSRTCVEKEGCLSLPNVYADIERPSSVYIEYFDLNGKKNKAMYSGTYARCIQHEFDHLQGVMFIDYLNFWHTFDLQTEGDSAILEALEQHEVIVGDKNDELAKQIG